MGIRSHQIHPGFRKGKCGALCEESFPVSPEQDFFPARTDNTVNIFSGDETYGIHYRAGAIETIQRI